MKYKAEVGLLLQFARVRRHGVNPAACVFCFAGKPPIGQPVNYDTGLMPNANYEHLDRGYLLLRAMLRCSQNVSKPELNMLFNGNHPFISPFLVELN